MFSFCAVPFCPDLLCVSQGRNVLLVDDSIVRGTTANEIVQMARDAGARKVYFTSAAPPIRYPNIYGIDIPTQQELIAFGRDEEAIAKKIGADWMLYVLYWRKKKQ